MTAPEPTLTSTPWAVSVLDVRERRGPLPTERPTVNTARGDHISNPWVATFHGGWTLTCWTLPALLPEGTRGDGPDRPAPVDLFAAITSPDGVTVALVAHDTGFDDSDPPQDMLAIATHWPSWDPHTSRDVPACADGLTRLHAILLNPRDWTGTTPGGPVPAEHEPALLRALPTWALWHTGPETLSWLSTSVADPGTLYRWRQDSPSDDFIKAWCGLLGDPLPALAWHQAGFTPEAADAWLTHVRLIDAATAQVLRDCGWDPRKDGPVITDYLLADLFTEHGVRRASDRLTAMAQATHQVGLAPADAIVALTAGMTPAELLTAHTDGTLDLVALRAIAALR